MEKELVEAKNEAAGERVAENGYGDPSVQTMSIKAIRKGRVVTVWAGVLKFPIQIVLCNYGTLDEIALA